MNKATAPSVPASHSLVRGTVGHSPPARLNIGTTAGTTAGTDTQNAQRAALIARISRDRVGDSKRDTIANNRPTAVTMAEIAEPPPPVPHPPENTFSQSSTTAARFFLDKAIPQGTAQGLAWLLDSLPHNPHLSPAQRAQAEAALHWLADEEYGQRCYILFN